MKALLAILAALALAGCEPRPQTEAKKDGQQQAQQGDSNWLMWGFLGYLFGRSMSDTRTEYRYVPHPTPAAAPPPQATQGSVRAAEPTRSYTPPASSYSSSGSRSGSSSSSSSYSSGSSSRSYSSGSSSYSGSRSGGSYGGGRR